MNKPSGTHVIESKRPVALCGHLVNVVVPIRGAGRGPSHLLAPRAWWVVCLGKHGNTVLTELAAVSH